VCRQLAERGHSVLLTARSAAAAAAAARVARTEPLQLDVTDPASIAAAARQVAERYSRLDILINNAAITYDTWQRAVGADLAVVREAAETNLYGAWLMVQQFLPLLRASEHPRIVNVSSEAASLASMGLPSSPPRSRLALRPPGSPGPAAWHDLTKLVSPTNISSWPPCARPNRHDVTSIRS
jgi:NAD(P)-dependent dehydrogenase (short-subunit alcohol dehydrogenase family)